MYTYIHRHPEKRAIWGICPPPVLLKIKYESLALFKIGIHWVYEKLKNINYIIVKLLLNLPQSIL